MRISAPIVHFKHFVFYNCNILLRYFIRKTASLCIYTECLFEKMPINASFRFIEAVLKNVWASVLTCNKMLPKAIFGAFNRSGFVVKLSCIQCL